ncbi:undecaprenyl pyrophosphate synthetase [Dongia mobilis]|uniref:Isoprenyl transferase n=2 Tax=Dongia mobilis TaxID=578943 RepID=A0A4R6WQG5_9PROT|nr:undecaprenyl pyrophosphate synthetase [Dongia mobilis]
MNQPRRIAEVLNQPAGEVPPPRHVAIIMDGNGRWARARGLPRTVGHNYGAEAVRQAVKGAAQCGVDYLTLFGFSSENWKRPAAEIDDLMGLLKLYLNREIDELHQNGVRLKVIGDRERLGADVVRLIEAAEGRTAGNSRLVLTVALSYGARAEIVLAARRLLQAAERGEVSPGELDETAFESFLLTAGMPDPDLLIRTSGEKRISNFLLWQCAYAEFVFLDKHWPDFGIDDLQAAIAEYQGRSRRYGAAQ